MMVLRRFHNDGIKIVLKSSTTMVLKRLHNDYTKTV